MDIDDIVSESDKKLLELAGGLCCEIASVHEIFEDRNSKEISLAFKLGTVSTLIESIFNVKIDPVHVYSLIKAYGVQIDNKDEE